MSFFSRIVLDRGNGIVGGSLWVWVGSGGCCALYDGSLFFMLFTCSNTRGVFLGVLDAEESGNRGGMGA